MGDNYRPGYKKSQNIDWGFVNNIVKEAKRQKLWINVGKDWFTPDEFSNYCHVERKFDSDIRLIDEKDVKLKDPIPVINKMRAYLDQEEKKLSDFATKVAAYFKG